MATPAPTVRDYLPRRGEFTRPGQYARAAMLHRRLRKGGFTMTSPPRGRALFTLAALAERDGVEGDLVDCGVWNGGSSVLLAEGAPSRRVWAFDSFEGLPDPGPLDGQSSIGRGGDNLGSEERVRAAFARFSDPARLRIVPGWFQDTFPREGAEVGRIAVLHVDGDWYESVKLTLEAFYGRISPGGFVVVDDYGHWEGARIATDEFRAARGIDVPLVQVDYTGHYWRVPKA